MSDTNGQEPTNLTSPSPLATYAPGVVSENENDPFLPHRLTMQLADEAKTMRHEIREIALDLGMPERSFKTYDNLQASTDPDVHKLQILNTDPYVQLYLAQAAMEKFTSILETNEVGNLMPAAETADEVTRHLTLALRKFQSKVYQAPEKECQRLQTLIEAMGDSVDQKESVIGKLCRIRDFYGPEPDDKGTDSFVALNSSSGTEEKHGKTWISNSSIQDAKPDQLKPMTAGEWMERNYGYKPGEKPRSFVDRPANQDLDRVSQVQSWERRIAAETLPNPEAKRDSSWISFF